MDAWLTFALSAAAVAAAGVRLARDGDTIAAGTGLGGMWVGAILVAAATSMPELTTDVAAVWQGHRSLAVGDLFGSSMANMAVLGVADLATRQTRMLMRVTVNQTLVGVLGMILTLVAAIGVLQATPPVLGIGLATWVIAFAYVVGMRMLHRNRGEPPFRTPAEVAEQRPTRRALQRAGVQFAGAAVVIVVAAPFLAASTAVIADRLGISQGFAGLVLLAITTSLPEAAVSAASIRAGSYDLAVGNLLGSNCFNMAALVPLDIVDGPTSLLAEVDPALVMAALFSVLLTALAVLDVLNKAERKVWIFEVGPAGIVLAYVVGLVLTYHAHP